ncbi:hypothetical protein ACFS2C_27900 [Prauserella oleivorans]|uniref:TIGR01620 family protein n=1 Tax=Prauserella oleivorans TaxID=1478153 RepID=A0ABW5WI59_9PSEU
MSTAADVQPVRIPEQATTQPAPAIPAPELDDDEFAPTIVRGRE